MAVRFSTKNRKYGAFKRTRGETVFQLVNVCFMLVLCVSTFYPFWHELVVSLTGSNVSSVSIYLWPPVVSFSNYARVFASTYIWTGFYNTLFRVVIGGVLTLVFSIHIAYVLSKRYYPHRNLWTAFIVFTMFFSGGMIPDYILIRSLGLINSPWSLILPGMLNTFNLIIIRNFFQSVPDSLEESARIDGANDIVILYKIILPLSLPIIATVSLWTAVANWNAWFDSMIYINDPKRMVLQTILRRVVLEGTQQLMDMQGAAIAQESSAYAVSTESIKAATVMVATVPILLAYPFIQKYFVKGVMIGSLKG